MTKARIVEKISRTILVSHKEAGKIVDTALESIVDALRRGDKVEIRGFGSFRTRTRAARKARNPRSGDSVDVPARTIAFFRPSKQLRGAVLDAHRAED